jgi:hypothetical protein
MGMTAVYLGIGALAGAAAGGAFGGSKPPAPPPPKPMPAPPDDLTLARQRQSELAQQQALHGRLSTILTGDSDKLGG